MSLRDKSSRRSRVSIHVKAGPVPKMLNPTWEPPSTPAVAEEIPCWVETDLATMHFALDGQLEKELAAALLKQSHGYTTRPVEFIL